MKLVIDDGGRAAAGYKGDAGDCGVRAIAIATGKPYQEVYDAINLMAQSERTGKRKRGKSNARTGVYRKTAQKYLETIGWKWTPTMRIGSGCKVHLRDGELPTGRLVLRVSRHFIACIDHVLHDAYDPQRIESYHEDSDAGDFESKRCVYGYFSQA